MLFLTSLLSFVAARALGHAVVESPTPRKPGKLFDTQCGAGLTRILRRDLASPIEDALRSADANYNCNAYVCRGYQYESNGALHTYNAGESVNFHINLVAGHRPGYANVSVIDPVKNVVISSPLKTWADWPITNPGPDRDDLDFSITIPDDLGSICTEGGKCAIQWYWYSLSNSQTYESCVDFVVSA
ncbi:hypothetical protein S7711_09968 [Stachybotrys chartarum IBT 7711]|uniref:Chitin-binding type-4 domain-containing protein n=1 Tax=Stachybotrys chartarum (strain CBS 109288 / IBT 7711) TaxID=1280523 RepID=A0A084AP47_STACB|nr:hypothetical protein S7711_09968 [Stachybotrys chartarum IBT 7711]KFA52569.1 hypothetical protein S40293_11202 [Stachybotrys chartarum IBT 40293]